MPRESAIYVYIFWVDNVFSSLVASALCEVFPQYSFSRRFTVFRLLEMLAYDLLVVLVTSFLCWFAIRAFRAAQLRQQASNQPVRNRDAVRNLFSKLLAYGSSFTMATVHKMAVTFGWLGLQTSINGNADVIGSFGSGTGQCKDKRTTTVVLISLVYAVLICGLLLALSIIIIEASEFQQSRMRRFLLRMLSESYSIAVGWSIFNVSETIFKCGLPSLYTSGEGEIFRGLLTTAIGFALYTTCIYERRDSSKSLLTWGDAKKARNGSHVDIGSRGACARWLQHLIYFGDKSIHVTVALTIVDTYLIPIQRIYGSSMGAFMWLSTCAVVISIAASVLTVWSTAALRDTPYYNFFIKSAGWVAAYSWWYAFDVVLKSLYGHSYLVRALLTLSIGVLVTVVTAAIATLLLHIVFNDTGDEVDSDPGSSETSGLMPKDSSSRSVSHADGTAILLNQSAMFAFALPTIEDDEAEEEESSNSIVI